jgi:hypothetical protein
MPIMTAPKRRVLSLAPVPRTGTGLAIQRAATGLMFGTGGQSLLSLPFDALRFQYASAVQAGLAQRSLLASGRFERAIDAIEVLILGPLARRR